MLVTRPPITGAHSNGAQTLHFRNDNHGKLEPAECARAHDAPATHLPPDFPLHKKNNNRAGLARYLRHLWQGSFILKARPTTRTRMHGHKKEVSLLFLCYFAPAWHNLSRIQPHCLFVPNKPCCSVLLAHPNWLCRCVCHDHAKSTHAFHVAAPDRGLYSHTHTQKTCFFTLSAYSLSPPPSNKKHSAMLKPN